MVNRRISVVIPTYNRPEVTKRAILSALNQKNISDLEVVVVDDGSTDNTREVIEGLNDPRVKYIYQDNGGVSKARNTGIKAATGDFIALLDSDDFLRQFSLAFRAQFLIDNPEYDVVSGSVVELDPELKVYNTLITNVLSTDTLDSNTFKFGINYQLSEEKDIKKFHEKLLEFSRSSNGGIPFLISSTMIRKDSLQKIELFNENLRNSEDLEFIARISGILRIKFFFMTVFAFIQFQDDGLSKSLKKELITNQQKEALNMLGLQI
jgi:glycosyltransferase involved in cell wall biosynthesis